MAATEIKTDGTFSFYGGMDLSRAPYEIGRQQFVNAVNMAISKVGDNLQPRPGWHWQTIQFNSPKEQRYFETGNVQGAGWYYDGSRDCMAISVGGYVFYLRQTTQGHWFARCINLGSPNNPNQTKVWTCRIPGNRIVVSDGQALPFVLGLDGNARRTDPSKGELTPCRAMAYVQNRLWFVNESATAVFFSDQNNALTVFDMIDNNVFGFVPPDDRERITAVGQQRYLNFDQNGGELVFSTEKNVYAVNVLANVPVNEWGENNIGLIRLVLPNVGATSAFSFTNYNTNLFFRTGSLGVANYQQLQTQWKNNDELVSNSIEVDYYYSQDTSWMLDQCYSVNYKGRLLTTVSPFLAQTVNNGFVAWNGLISMNPAPYYGGGQRLPRRFEGLWTGVRPWALIHQESVTERLFCVSYDGDQKNRVYQLSDDDRYDIGPDDKPVPIKCIVETRSFSFETLLSLKAMDSRFYTLDSIKTDVKVHGYSRTSLSGSWRPFWAITHYVGKCDPALCFPFNPVSPQSRNEYYLAREDQDCKRFNYMQYRFEFEGDFELSAFGASAVLQPDEKFVQCQEDAPRVVTELTCPLKYFDYKIVNRITTTEPTPNARRPISTSSSSQSNCGC